MFYLKDGLSLKSQLSVFSALVFHYTAVFLLLTHSCGGQPQVIGPTQPIVAIVGDDIILPCRLKPATDVVAMTLEWARPNLNPRFVHVWRDGRELLINKNPSYVGRTSLFSNKLKHGDISLKLSKVKLSDDGKYRCFIPSLGRDSIIELVVGAVSSPFIGITKNSSAVDLGCESKGWYPEPEVFWLDGEGNILSAGPTETVRGPDGLYTVSSRVTVEKTDTNRFTCRVQQQNISQTREREIHVPDEFFMVPSSSAGHITIVLAVVFMCIAAVVFVVWRWRRNKIKTKMHHEDKTEQREGEKKTISLPKSLNNDNEGQVLMEGERDREAFTAERVAMKELDKKKTKLEEELQKKEGKCKNAEEVVARLMGRKKELEDQRKQLKLELKEVETKREAEEKQLRSAELQIRRGKRVKVKANKKDLETRKSELDEQLQNTEKELVVENSEITRMTEKKSKAENNMEQIKLELKETEKQRDEIERKIQSVTREVTERETEKTNLKIQQEAAERENQEFRQETELQAEQQKVKPLESPEKITEETPVFQ
ncbi:butyrophilin subfamily 3 member A2-like [Centroberyx affinis]|uniref:butyrophilin subfamily 3 member A2-like n=1 Tax=Centroberyx affinis TaxID=166261 RepID=UPI003A5C3DCA